MLVLRGYRPEQYLADTIARPDYIFMILFLPAKALLSMARQGEKRVMSRRGGTALVVI